MWIAILATFVITALLVVVSMNFHRPEKSVRHHVSHCHAIDDPQFQREMDAMLGPAVLAGNRSPRCRTATRSSRRCWRPSAARSRSITFETYIYWSGEIGQQFADALKERARPA